MSNSYLFFNAYTGIIFNLFLQIAQLSYINLLINTKYISLLHQYWFFTLTLLIYSHMPLIAKLTQLCWSTSQYRQKYSYNFDISQAFLMPYQPILVGTSSNKGSLIAKLSSLSTLYQYLSHAFGNKCITKLCLAIRIQSFL